MEGFGLTSYAKGWTKFGWQGITMDIPADWSLGAISGDKNEGYLRLDDPYMPRVEIKWRDAQKGTPALPDVVQKYLDDLEKTVSKKKVDIKTENGVDISKMVRRLPDKDIQGFYWKSSTKAYGMATFCRECRRIVIMQLVSPIDNDVTSQVSRVFSSFEDHGLMGTEDWSVYDMAFKIPVEFALKDQKLMPGLLSFSFSRENEPYVLKIDRWGLTDVILGEYNGSIKDWYEAEYGKHYKGYKVKFEEAKFNSHQGFKAGGEIGRWFHEWRLTFEKLTKSKTPTHYHSNVWHCPETKKIYVVSMSDRDPINSVVDFISSYIKCHEEEQFDTTDEEE
jgi:hypothetical protein